MSYNDFHTNIIHSDFLRPNRFRVSSRTLGVGLTVKAASLPQINIGTAPAFYAGRSIPLPGDATLDPWTVTIYIDKKADLYLKMVNWSKNAVFNIETNNGKTYGSIQKEDIKIEHVSRDNNIITSTTIKDAWPTIISPVELDHSNNNSVSEVQITFNYENITYPQ